MGSIGQKFVKKVEIRPIESHPFTITEAKAEKNDDLKFELQKGEGGYVLTVTVTRTAPGNFFDKIRLTTDSPVKPEIVVPVFGSLFEGVKP